MGSPISYGVDRRANGAEPSDVTPVSFKPLIERNAHIQSRRCDDPVKQRVGSL